MGIILILLSRGAERKMSKRDGYCIASLAWVLFSAFGMLPFYLSGSVDSICNAFFETMSGFTTTGATIMDNIDAQSHGILFWRSLTQWIGGLGIVCFALAILPIFNEGNMQLFTAEATGVTHHKIHPKISIMVKWIWGVYLALTIAATILLYLGGMNWFDAVCHAFATTATGGYSTKQASIAYWNSPFIEYVVSFFMIVSSFNFALFQVSSIHTSCGFATEDYTLWPPFTWMLIIFAMLAGGCTGSTGGGIKNLRIMIMFHNIVNEFKRLIHPSAVLPVRINKHVQPQATVNAVMTFITVYLLCAFIGFTSLMALGVNFMEAFSTVISSLGNIGPGLGAFGPAYSWNALPEAAKWILSFLMLIGRLELFSVLVLFTPAFWKEW